MSFDLARAGFSICAFRPSGQPVKPCWTWCVCGLGKLRRRRSTPARLEHQEPQENRDGGRKCDVSKEVHRNNSCMPFLVGAALNGCRGRVQRMVRRLISAERLLERAWSRGRISVSASGRRCFALILAGLLEDTPERWRAQRRRVCWYHQQRRSERRRMAIRRFRLRQNDGMNDYD